MAANFGRIRTSDLTSGEEAGSGAANAGLENVLAEISTVSLTRKSGVKEQSAALLQFAPGEFDMSKPIDFSQAYVPKWLANDKT